MDYAKLDQTLRSHGQRSTVARRTVYNALCGEEPLTIHELAVRCTQIDRASVYRSVALFERLGVVQRLQTGWKYKLELAGDYHEHHHHATCLDCGRLLVLAENKALEGHLRRAAREVGFYIERHQLELQGYCASCRQTRHLPVE